MFDKLENCLNKWVVPPRREAIMSAFTVLDAHGSHRAWTEVSQYLEYAEGLEPVSQILDTIDNCLHIDLDTMLQAHTVMMDASIVLKTEVLEGLLVMQSIEDTHTLLAIIDSADNEMDGFMELLGFVLNKPWEHFSEGILSVSTALLDKLTEQLESVEATVESAPYEVADNKVAKLIPFMERYASSLLVTAVTDDGRVLGTPLDILRNAYKVPLLLLEQTDAKRAAIELVGFTLLSDTPLADVYTVAKQQAALIYSDINFLTAIDIAIEPILREVIHG